MWDTYYLNIPTNHTYYGLSSKAIAFAKALNNATEITDATSILQSALTSVLSDGTSETLAAALAAAAAATIDTTAAAIDTTPLTTALTNAITDTGLSLSSTTVVSEAAEASALVSAADTLLTKQDALVAAVWSTDIVITNEQNELNDAFQDIEAQAESVSKALALATELQQAALEEAVNAEATAALTDAAAELGSAEGILNQNYNSSAFRRRISCRSSNNRCVISRRCIKY